MSTPDATKTYLNLGRLLVLPKYASSILGPMRITKKSAVPRLTTSQDKGLKSRP